MALQPFQVSDGSTIYFDTSTKKIMTEGGKQDSFYSAGDIDEAKTVWNNRLANKNAKSSGGGQVSTLGSSTLTAGAPTIDLNSIYDKAMNSKDILDLQKEVDTKKQALNTAMTNINDNPFASEATRVGKLARLSDSAGREINTAVEQLAQKKADAQVKINIATQQYQIDSQEYQNELSKLNTLISSGAIMGASGTDLAQIALATGISTSMLKGIVDTAKKSQEKLQIATNDNGDVTIYDLNTGKVKSTIKGIGNKQGGTAGSEKTQRFSEATQALESMKGVDGKVDETVFDNTRNAFRASGGTLEEFNSNFYNYINTEVNPARYGVPESVYNPDKFKSTGSAQEQLLQSILYPKK